MSIEERVALIEKELDTVNERLTALDKRGEKCQQSRARIYERLEEFGKQAVRNEEQFTKVFEKLLEIASQLRDIAKNKQAWIIATIPSIISGVTVSVLVYFLLGGKIR